MRIGATLDTFGGSVELAEKLAEEGCLIEVLVRRRTKESQFMRDLSEKGQLRLHGAWWTKFGRRHFYGKDPLKTAIFDVMMGPWENNPAAHLAQKYRAPVVLHHGVVLELLARNELNRQTGSLLKPEVENDNYLTYPWSGKSKFSDYVDCMGAVIRARRQNSRFGHVLDIGHLAETNWKVGEEVFEDCLKKALDYCIRAEITVVSAHLSGYDPEGFREHLFLRDGAIDVGACVKLLVAHNSAINLIVESPSVSYRGSIERRKRPQPWFDKTCDDIKWLQDVAS